MSLKSLARNGVATLGLMVLLAGCGGGGGGGSSSSGGNPPVDTTPNGFTFVAQTGMMPSTEVTSAEVTITGINSGAAITITGGEYSIDGGAFTSAAGTVNNNQRVRVRLTASSQFSTLATASLSVGGVSGTFNATTVAADTTPAAFTFAYGVDATRNDWVSSGSVLITDINTTTPVSIENGEYSIDGGAFTSAAGTITNGQAIMVRVRASADWSRVTRAQLTVGTVTSAFEVTAELPAYVPDAIAYDGQDTVYLLNNANRLVFRWMISQSRYVDPLALAAGTATPTRMAHSPSHQRLYFGYESGAITQLALAAPAPAEQAFATAANGITSIGSAGNFLVVQTSGGYGSGYVYNGSGVVVDQGGYYYGYSSETAWDPANTRMYYTRDGLSPNDLHYDVIDQTTGEVSSTGETPYHGAYNISGPIRVSADGQYVLLGSGDIYSRQNLDWSGSLGGQVADARWFTNGSLVSLTSASNQTTLRRLAGANLSVVEQRTFTGAALRVVGTDTVMAVLIANGGDLQIHTYLPDDDSDDDGVENTVDAFPLDLAASVDNDRDGFPDAWNAGRTQADSTTGLALDAFPQDAACWLSTHAATGGGCDFGATIPNYTPDQVAHNGDVVYLLSTANRRVYRWSLTTGSYLNPYVVGVDQGFTTISPTIMAFVGAHNRLYLGYQNGAVRYIDADAASPVENAFATAAAGIHGLASAGNYLAVQSGGYDGGKLYSSAGVITDGVGYHAGYSREATWDPVNLRLYYTRDSVSPNDLHYDTINQTTGEVTASSETPYHGDYDFQAPIRVSANGQYILLGTGDLYRHTDLTWAGSLGGIIADARWFSNGSLVTLSTSGNQTTLRRLSSNNLGVLEQRTFTGEAMRIVGSDATMVVLVMNAGVLQFHAYVPDDDSDDDGVVNTSDAFPLDRAASVDSDGDGFPDLWNAGRTQADSTTGLALDAFPQDSACWLTAHGSGGVCDYGASVPNYTPDRIAYRGDTIYLLSSANRRVYRWSMSTAQYLNPFIVGINQGFTTLAPTTIAHSPGHQRLYLGYPNGAIQYIDLAPGSTSAAEVPFAIAANGISGLGDAGNFLAAHTLGYNAGALYSASGTVTQQGGYYYGYSREMAWDAPNSRLYYTHDGVSPNDLQYDVIDQTTGQVTSSLETPYHGTFSIIPPIRVSTDGQSVLLGSGDVYALPGLTFAGSLGKQFTDAHWTPNFLVSLDTTDRVEIRDAYSREVLQSYQYTGTPLRVIFGQTETYLVHVLNGTTAFVRLAFYDQDDDTIPRWWEQLYSLDDTNAADAALDPDTDGLDNAAEYAANTHPLVADTDGDGLDDAAEVNTHHTIPTRADSDGDGLSDGAEVNTHQTNPLDADSDDDGYTDLLEVLQGGDPNDATGLPQPLTNYSQTFEGVPELAAWTMPQGSEPWAVDTQMAHGGSASLKSGTANDVRFSVVRFRGYFASGVLSFWARLDNTYCCNRVYVYVDGQSGLYLTQTGSWDQYMLPLTAGIHDIEWRIERDYYTTADDAARIDDVAFTAQ